VTNVYLDCAGTCNTSYVDDCGVCQVRGFSTEKDCNGDCLGSAIIGDCDECVLGLCRYLQHILR
jgi:hypothetical protein